MATLIYTLKNINLKAEMTQYNLECEQVVKDCLKLVDQAFTKLVEHVEEKGDDCSRPIQLAFKYSVFPLFIILVLKVQTTITGYL